MRTRVIRTEFAGVPRTIAILSLLIFGANALQSANPVPSVSLPLVPDIVVPGSSSFRLTVNGTGFVTTSSVTWNGSNLPTTYVSSSQLTAAVAASNVSVKGSALIVVTNPAPGGGTSNAVQFLVAAPVATLGFAPSATGAPLFYLALADFNRDGNLDAAGINFGSEVSVALGKGDGSFGSPNVIQLPVSVAQSVVTGDFNGDKKVDIAVLSCNQNDSTCQSGGTLSILLGNGDGSFGAPINSQTDALPIGLVASDFNGDGILDLVLSHFDKSGTLSVLLGNGDGTFRTPVKSTVEAEIFSIVSGDFNGDGKPDLALGLSAPLNAVEVLLGNGDGTFSFGSEFALLVGGHVVPNVIAAGDLNHDGKQDLVAAGSVYGFVALGTGDGTFMTPAVYNLGTGAYGIAIADLNADGVMDLAFSDGQQTTVSVMLGKGDGTFQLPQSYEAGTQTFSAAPADLNKDGLMDLVFAGNSGLVALIQTTVQFFPTALTFTPENVGTTSQPQSVTLTNGESTTLTISAITITGANASDFAQTNTCGSRVAPGASCTISVTFTPTDMGTRSASVSVADNGPGSPQTLSLTGTGLAPQVSLSTGALVWNTQPVGVPAGYRHVQITNAGGETLTIQSIGVTGANAGDFTITNNNCGSSLQPGKFCSPTLRFTARAVGTRSAALTLTDNAPDSPQTVSLSGTGTFVALSPQSVNFGSIAVGKSSTPVPVTLTNNGTSPLTISSIALGGSKPGDYSQTNNCPTTLNTGAACTITITFTPTATGSRSALVVVTDSDAGSPQRVYLNGTGM